MTKRRSGASSVDGAQRHRAETDGAAEATECGAHHVATRSTRSGDATMIAVDHDFELACGEGNAVTGRYLTSHVDLIATLTLENGEVIEGTSKHPIWNSTKGQFVELGEMEPGHSVDTQELGRVRVASVAMRDLPQPVFNVEIAGQHVYAIGNSGVLVHNNEYDELADAAKLNASKGLPNRVKPDALLPTESLDELGEGFVKHLADEMRAAKGFKGAKNTPPVEVFRNSKGQLEIVDGHHRFEAARRAGVEIDIASASLEKLKAWLGLKGRLDELR